MALRQKDIENQRLVPGFGNRGPAAKRWRISSLRKALIEGVYSAAESAAAHIKAVADGTRHVRESFRQNAAGRVRTPGAEIAGIEKKTDQLMERIMRADSETLVAAYEQQIRKPEIQRIKLTENAANNAKPLPTSDELYRTARAFLAKPCKLRTSEHLEHGRTVLGLAFPGRWPAAGTEVIEPPEPQSLSGFQPQSPT